MAIEKRRLENGGLILFLLLVTIALLAVVFDFVGALLWAALAAIIFQPLFQRLLGQLRGRRNLAAAATLLIITVAVVIPTLVVAAMVVDEAAGVYQQIGRGNLNAATYFDRLHDAMPRGVRTWLDNSGYDSFDRVRARLTTAVGASVSTIAQQALSIGRNAAAFLLTFGVGLYVTFFLLRDGEFLGPAIVRGVPLDREVSARLAERFVAVVRATIKGSGVVALVQGALGAATFAVVGLPAVLLFGVVMAIAALLPAIGPAIIWVPVAIYLAATGAVWQAVVVVASGVFVIGLADNVLRPILVGRDTGIPDWMVLVTTLGGINLLGLSGIVVGPLAAALFLTGWQILNEQRGTRLPEIPDESGS